MNARRMMLMVRTSSGFDTSGGSAIGLLNTTVFCVVCHDTYPDWFAQLTGGGAPKKRLLFEGDIRSEVTQLLHDVQLYALSETLPQVSKHFYYVYKRASAFYHANYILGRILQEGEPQTPEIYSKALRYPLCDQKVLATFVELVEVRIPNRPPASSKIQLPRRLFRDLDSDSQHAIEFLQALYLIRDIPKIDTNANNGYALAKAINAECIPLVKLLLEHHASPKHKDGLAVKIAIRKRSLEMVKLLVERPVDPTLSLAKKRKTGDRVKLTSEMLRIAIAVQAHEVVEYLHREKNIIPDFKTLKKMGS